ncbi:vWA domain-containing protein [Allomesorhizobium camelthorni]|uniref:VWA domain-containing protein n=1 Tax=Allomesorhizobium camelthorni TaxID=475069 RepID=A0A6G4W7E4_9HYPH|nr:VWA domain-containing protein [Mesorhizobium camelthorni]NGO50163.1 VWA domain-containing protein [Mesorhizobium camelthorni]
MANDELDMLRTISAPPPGSDAKSRALQAALRAYDLENSSAPAQGSRPGRRLTDRIQQLWSGMMQKKLYAAPALATLVALPVAGYATFYLMGRPDSPFMFGTDREVAEAPQQRLQAPLKKREADAARRNLAAEPQPAPQSAPAAAMAPAAESVAPVGGAVGFAGGSRSMADQMAQAPSDAIMPMEDSNDRVQEFETNPVRSALETPVSTFSVDVDTASYSFVRRSLKEGVLPQPDTVRVEEMINYFPYDWKSPETAETPFNPTVTIMPTPWNDHTRLMHVAIKGFDVKPAEQPRASLVFLIDVSGSMNEQDKLPLLRSAFRLLVGTLRPDDTVSIVTYAGAAGTVLEPTRAAERDKILQAIDTLTPGGSTAGEAGIREAYRLAESSFVEGGVNRVMLATDGDFNVGQSDDDELKRLIEEKRESGVFLSVFGFGRGNLNDQMMQTIAQNGNGTAAYIDTLAEAEKVLVQDASSTLFPIAKDVKIQVEFNPEKVSEYRLIGYETRALKREDFNNDRIDAGEIGSGHSVTAIYEITPKGSPAVMIDDLRYGSATANHSSGAQNAGEYAFVKIRYKLPDGDVSKLITTPVTAANEAPSLAAASDDQRFSVAVAAFGQKLRNADQTEKLGYDRIIEIAAAARGADPYGYRSEFLSLVRLASALDSGKR